MMNISFRVIVILGLVSYSHGDPVQAAQQDGPCTGMNCLHGVLMHNDDSDGDEHKVEDQYLKFKETLDTGEKPEIGTKHAENELHEMLMHDGKEGHHEEEGAAEMLPELAVEKGPMDPNNFLHEAMHGEEGVNKHDWDENKEEVPVLHEPIKGDKFMHDVLMHGGKEHVDEAADTAGDAGGPSGPEMGEEFMHGVLMHGDKDHKHDSESDDAEKDANGKQAQPLDAEGLLHGVLMHGDSGHGHEHHDSSDEEDAVNKQPPGPRGDDLHGVLMHGDSEYGKDHSHDDSESEKSEPFSDILEILNMDLDEQLLKVIDIEKLLKKDMEEYNEWIKNNPQYQDDTLSGSTNIGVTDSLLSDIELMKAKYLEPSNTDDSSESSSSDSEEYDFTAEDAKSILEAGTTDQGEEEDMRHYLELLGSTEPLNARHKVKLELLKKKINKDL